MKLAREQSCDVLVLGSGIAGITAAIEAAEAGCSVILASAGKLFSGSSFYPGTWGLGLIEPDGDGDIEDLAHTIDTVGCGMANPEMVRVFVEGIHPAVEKVRRMGIALRRADRTAEKEFIPCFDHKHRGWNGIEFASAKEVYSVRIAELGIVTLPKCEALDLVQTGSRVCGAVVFYEGALRFIGCKSVVMATGGYGSIFKNHLCTDDVSGLGQSLALHAGCSLVNMEFMQMMPGYLSPARQTVFNEKAFRFSKLRRSNGRPLFEQENAEILALRATHGPFTSRLPSKEIDFAIFQESQSDPNGVLVTYTDEMRSNPPEFIRVYFDWLEKTHGLTMADPIHIGIFAHAANGGIQIAKDAYAGVPGLFAAGEVTGGMHGADRIGGLSTANGLTFGIKAGRSAALACKETGESPRTCSFDGLACADCGAFYHALQEIMSCSAMVVRDGEHLADALEQVSQMQQELGLKRSEDAAAVASTRRLCGQLLTAECILSAASLRTESRGSHYRADYPEENAALAVPIQLKMESGKPAARFLKQ